MGGPYHDTLHHSVVLNADLDSNTEIIGVVEADGNRGHRPVTCVTGQARKASLFTEIAGKGTTGVAIGPLEYCGNAIHIMGPGGKEIISPCREDPMLNNYIIKRTVR
ncbi:hypothetical protein V5O48_017402, partial [Marasmius crinis-equi]